ncbi:hypothetical protein [Leptolyngbya sp. FACHB-261]|uniref:hypothetical protein n=1 Tax=Leptolyngbya sp. FACHB-261 TaxID=2692806 RepID=UPI00168950E0|nr:hypothetical protein [Leptolyngbya sp. FACHB-261]MBD2103441.1 hypothetical protein [Leptolyngbya sp. FACHB-261]
MSLLYILQPLGRFGPEPETPAPQHQPEAETDHLTSSNQVNEATRAAQRIRDLYYLRRIVW